VTVPNVSAWRKKTVGDLTSTLFLSSTNTSVPALPVPPVPTVQHTGTCSTVSQDLEDGGADPDLPTNQTMPNQQGGTAPASAQLTSVSSSAGPDGAEVTTAAVRRTGPRPMTIKSSYNRLAYPRAD